MSSRKDRKMVCCGFWLQQKLDWTRLDHGQDQGSDHRLHHRPNKKGFKKLTKKKNIYIYIEREREKESQRVYLVLNAVVAELSIHKLKN